MIEHDANTIASLPTNVSGEQSTGWWGVVLLIAIETTVFSALIVSYLYLYSNATAWPPSDIPVPDLLMPSIMTVILVASSIPIVWADRGVRKNNRNQLVIGYVISFLLGLAFLVLKVIEFSDKSYQWDDHAYGSIFWLVSGFHALHLTAALLKNASTQVLAWMDYFHHNRFVFVQTTAIYWNFVVILWIPIFIVLYLFPHFA